jgi:hypothetical protein
VCILYIYSNWYVLCCLVDCLLAESRWNCLLYIYSTPPDDGPQKCPKHVEVEWRNKLRMNSATSWFSSHGSVTQHKSTTQYNSATQHNSATHHNSNNSAPSSRSVLLKIKIQFNSEVCCFTLFFTSEFFTVRLLLAGTCYIGGWTPPGLQTGSQSNSTLFLAFNLLAPELFY